jgi:peptidyl-prolyl cis-trans isomerase B (cyclophilin B)
VPNLKDRQRAAARARLEREMAERQAQAAKRRRRRYEILGGVGVLAVIAAVVIVVVNVTGGSSKAPAAAASQAAATCKWTPDPALTATGAQHNPDLKNTGSPPLTTVPHNGTRAMTLDTSQGKIVITLDVSKAPCSAESFTYLAGKGFFDNTKCHRLTTAGIYVLQCGDPSGTGRGGPSYYYPHENLPTDQQPNYPAGVVAMANAGNKDQNGSQFFIVYQDTPVSSDENGQLQSNLQSDYTVIGTVTSGLDIVQKVGKAGAVASSPSDPTDGAPKLPVTIKTATVGSVQP